ncbi:MAG: phosphoglucosamine mutase [Bdellovibrionales bacterium]|nr:phosphoglucosamine mutase [Bdellovibrionales bacterium]
MKKSSRTSKSHQRLFGTDGIRGTANKFPITADLALKVGQAMGYILRRQSTHDRSGKPMVLIGKDTRLSGYMIEQALSSGLNSMGVWVQLTGPLPTPGIGFLARNMRAEAGIVISASHNAYHDNGIKIFGPDGYKIPLDMESEIEDLVFEKDLNPFLAPPNDLGRTRRIDDAAGRYIVFVKNAFPMDQTLDGLRIVLDCANGASYKVAPAIFEELGAEVIVLGDEPNGYNINDKSGALYPQRTCDAVRTYRADAGISLDGDADRVIMVDETGEIVNGDHILAVCAIHRAKMDDLPKSTVVTTQMSNMGLELALKNHGIRVVRVDVGDKYVVEEMRKHGYLLGGEQSGHIIHLDHTTTGDGCIAALSVLGVMKREKKKLSEMKEIMEDVPQVLVNTRVKDRRELTAIEGYPQLITRIEKELGGEGRTFVRFSGTEPVVRVLVEGRDPRRIGAYAEEIASFLQKQLT